MTDTSTLSKKEQYDLKQQEKQASRQKTAQSNHTQRNLVYGVIAIVIGLLGWGIWQGAQPTTSSNDFALQKSDIIYDIDHLKGEASASATLVEYSDFQCPACKSFAPIVERLQQEIGQDLKVVYRHFPLLSIHPNAMPAARATEAAARQNKFWEMHDLLFEKQSEWAKSKSVQQSFEQYAQTLGLDVEQFKKDYKDGAVLARVNRDLVFAKALDLNSTPSFILNGKKLDSEVLGSYESFKAAVEAVLKESTPAATLSQ